MRGVLTALAGLLLVSCTSTELDQGILSGDAWNVEAARGSDVPADPYLAALREGYLTLAEAERAEFDWNDAAEFRARALAAASGKRFGAFNPVERGVAEAALPDLQTAFTELSLFLGNEGAYLRAGRQLGEAQVQFDCWVQEAVEGHQQDDIAACRTAFEGLLILLRDLAALPDNMAVVLPDDDGGEIGGIVVRQDGKSVDLDRPFAAAGTGDKFGEVPVGEGEIRDAFSDALGARPKPPREFVITYGFDQTKISDAGLEQVRLAIEEARSRPAAEVIVTGHTDAVGSSAVNLAISRRRAEMVAREITKELDKVETVTILRGGEGERNLVVSSRRPEEANRRVVILVR